MKPEKHVLELGVKTISYAFTSAGLTPELAERHLTHAKTQLRRMFALPEDAVSVKHKARLPEGAPFVLTCYRGKSSCEVAIVLAAKAILPELRAYQSRSAKAALKAATAAS